MKISLVLSGGGAKGFAHVGVLKALLELGFEPEVISGTSAGALVGALYSSGYSPDEIMEIVGRTRIRRILRLSRRMMGILHTDKIETFIQSFIPHNSFEGLRIPLTISATDIGQGKTIYFNSGELIRPLMASCCIPVLFEPVRWQNYTLVDGGVLNNLPVEPVLNKSSFMIGVHTNPCGDGKLFTNMKSVVERSLMLAIQNNIVDRKTKCDFFIEPPELCNFTALDSGKAREIFEIGYVHTHRIASLLHESYLEKTGMPILHTSSFA